MPRRILIVANPVSGGGRARALAPALAAALRGHGIDGVVHFTSGAGDAARRARAAGAEDWQALVAVGGDGTVNEILNGMPDPSRPLGVLPLGTANVLAMELGLPRRPEAAAAVFAAGRTRSLAIGTANGRRFLLFCGAGIDGVVVREQERRRGRVRGKLKWLRPILHAARKWPAADLRAELADGTVLEELAMVLVTRVRTYGGMVTLPPGIDPDDGRLHAVCFRKMGRARFLWHALRGFLGRMRETHDLLVRPTTAVRITGGGPWQVDGDLGGEGPVDVALLPVQARLLVP